jgi:hypothetical protein
MGDLRRFLPFLLLALAALLLGACGGGLPADMSLDLPDDGDIRVEADHNAQEVEFSGVVESLSDDSWTVSGVSFAVTTATEIKGAFTVGDPVKVHALLDPTDQLTASEIEAAVPETEDLDSDNGFDDDEHDDEMEFTGAVDSMGGGSWVIGGKTVAILPSTEIKRSINLGDLVKVHAFDADGVLTAREIELAQGDDFEENPDDDDLDDVDDDEDDFYGTVEAIDGITWTVAGVTFVIDSDTEIEHVVQIGDSVKVVFTTDENGNVVAQEIELEENNEADSSDEKDDGDDDDFDDDDDDRDDKDEYDEYDDD